MKPKRKHYKVKKIILLDPNHKTGIKENEVAFIDENTKILIPDSIQEDIKSFYNKAIKNIEKSKVPALFDIDKQEWYFKD